MGHDTHLLLSLHSGPSDGLVGAGLVALVLADVSKILLCHAAIVVDLLQEGDSLFVACILKPLLEIAEIALDLVLVGLHLVFPAYFLKLV